MDMGKYALIGFRLPRKKLGMSTAEANRVYRKLYGYDNFSFYSRYRSRVPGLLDELKGIKLPRSAILIRGETAREVIEFLEENGAEVEVLSREVVLSEKEAKRLRLKP